MTWPGAEVTVGTQTITTDLFGMAIFSLANGSYSYSITAAGYTNKTGNFIVAGAPQTIEVAMNCVGCEIDVTFQVTSGGNSLEGAMVTVGSEVAYTNALGEAVIPLADGDYSYTVSKYGYDAQTGPFTVAGVALFIPVDLPMLPHYDVIFHVTDDGSINLEGALVDIDIEGVEDIITDLNGEAAFSLIDGTYGYTVSKSGYSTETGSITVIGAGFTQEVILSAVYDVTFIITFGGNPVQNAEITVGSETKFTDASGIAVFSLPDGAYSYTVVKSGFDLLPGNFNVAGANQTIELVLIQAHYDITFHVTDIVTLLPIQNAVVEIGTEQVLTNALGIAVFSLTDGEYYYTVNYPGYYEEGDLFNVAGGPMDIYVAMTQIPLYEVTIHVTSGGVDLAGAAVTIGTTTVTTNAQGNAVFNLPAGTYEYTAVKVGYITQTGSFLLIASPLMIEVDMPLQPYDITFYVSSGGNPIAGATVTVTPGPVTGVTNASGNAVLSLVNDTYDYTVDKAGYVPETGTFTVNNGPATIPVVLDLVQYTVTFHIVSTGGALEGVAVTCNGQTILTNASGNAVFSLVNGTYDYTCVKDGYITLTGASHC